MSDAELHVSDLDGKHWPRYRARRAVVARRLGGPTWIDGRYFRDGYLVRTRGAVVVMTVADFEAVYELAGVAD